MALTYPTVPHCIRANFQWYDGNGHFGGRLFFAAVGDPWVAADLNTFATNISNAWGTNLKIDVATSFSLTAVTTQDLSTTSGAVGSWSGSVVGTGGTNSPPSNACVNVRSIIADHYRGGHPVFHHPPAATTQLSSPRFWLGTYTNGVQTHFAAFIAAIQAGTAGGITTVTHVVLRHYAPGKLSTDVVKWPPISYRVSTRVGTMRRRVSTEA